MSLFCYDICVVGAGPAGLAFVHTLLGQHHLSIVVIDAGSPLGLREKESSEDLIQGEGGAGLWSDGKFSFYPAGRPVYELIHARSAFEKLKETFSALDVKIPEF